MHNRCMNQSISVSCYINCLRTYSVYLFMSVICHLEDCYFKSILIYHCRHITSIHKGRANHHLPVVQHKHNVQYVSLRDQTQRCKAFLFIDNALNILAEVFVITHYSMAFYGICCPFGFRFERKQNIPLQVTWYFVSFCISVSEQTCEIPCSTRMFQMLARTVLLLFPVNY